VRKQSTGDGPSDSHPMKFPEEELPQVSGGGNFDRNRLFFIPGWGWQSCPESDPVQTQDRVAILIGTNVATLAGIGGNFHRNTQSGNFAGLPGQSGYSRFSSWEPFLPDIWNLSWNA